MIHVKILKQSDKTHLLDLSSSYTKYECYNLLLPNCLYLLSTAYCSLSFWCLPVAVAAREGRGGYADFKDRSRYAAAGAFTLFVSPRVARCKQLQPPSWSPSRVKSSFIYPYGRCRHVDICRLSGLQSRYFSLSRLQCTKSRSSVDWFDSMEPVNVILQEICCYWLSKHSAGEDWCCVAAESKHSAWGTGLKAQSLLRLFSLAAGPRLNYKYYCSAV